MEYLTSLTLWQHVKTLALAIPVGFFAGNFLGGFVLCSNCGFNPLSRGMIGFVFLFMGSLGGGYVPKSGSGTTYHNLWVYIGPMMIASIVLFYYLGWKRQ